MAQGYQYRPYNPIPPKQSAQDFSYWGMKKQPTESLPSSLAQAASQRGAEIGNTIRNEWQNYQNAPSLGEVTKSQEAYYAENPEAMPSLQDTMMGVAEKGIDWMNPVPVSGLGMIAGASAKSFDWKAVEKTKELIQSGMTKEAAAAKTGYYFDRVGNPKTQFSDVGSEVSNAEVQRVADMAFGPQSKNLLQMEQGQARQLPTVFKHNKLYEEYPWLRTKGEVVYTDATNYAAMDAKYNKAGELLKAKILINPKGVRNYAKLMGVTYKEAMRTMILHEANHMVQAIDKLPRGSSGQWFKKMRVGIDLHEKKADQLRAVVRQMPPKAPRTNELKAELKELDDHVAFMKNTIDIDPDALYRHTTGEADSFWVQTMKDVKDPQFRVPAHERTESKRLMQEAPGRGVAPLSYVENWNTNLTPERIKALALPTEDMATLNSRWDMEQAMERGQSGLMKDLGLSKIDLGHTSPHKFTEFDLSKVGTGEGAQGFGHGVYLWEDPAVGKHYKDMFKDRMKAEVGGINSQIRAIEQKLNQPRGVSNQEAIELRSQLSELKSSLRSKSGPNVYDVEVSDKYAKQIGDYDAPLSEQPADVQKAIKSMLDETYDGGYKKTGTELIKALEEQVGRELTLSEIYKKLQTYNRMNEVALSKWLNENGVVGHKFWDGLSRSTQEGSRNYVIYNDTIPKMRGSRIDI